MKRAWSVLLAACVGASACGIDTEGGEPSAQRAYIGKVAKKNLAIGALQKLGYQEVWRIGDGNGHWGYRVCQKSCSEASATSPKFVVMKGKLVLVVGLYGNGDRPYVECLFAPPVNLLSLSTAQQRRFVDTVVSTGGTKLDQSQPANISLAGLGIPSSSMSCRSQTFAMANLPSNAS